jgi:hypothetical protein
MSKYAVVEYAGLAQETVIEKFGSYLDAFEFTSNKYDPDEIESLHVEIMKYGNDGQLTTEY